MCVLVATVTTLGLGLPVTESLAASLGPEDVPGSCVQTDTPIQPLASGQVEPTHGERGRDRSRATGSWNGTRESLENRGLVFLGSYTFDGSTVVAGDWNRRGVGRGLLSVGMGVDMLRLVGWRGASLFAGVHALRGANGAATVGDIQGYSNIDADEFETLAELWYEQRLLSERIRFKLGRVDANTEFAWVAAGGEFVNSSAGFSPTILFLPTYPNPAPSVNLFYQPTHAVRLGAGVYQRELEPDASRGRSSARFAIGEVGVTGSGSGTLGPRRLTIGGWYDDAVSAAHDGTTSNGTSGVYALAEQRFVVSPDGLWLDAFIQIGHADQSIGEFANHWSLGAVTPSPFAGRREDLVGAMISVVDLSDMPEAGFSDNETVFELFYAVPIAGFLRLKPDLQFVANPAGERGSTVVGTLRVELAF